MYRELNDKAQSSDLEQWNPRLYCERCNQEKDDNQFLVAVSPNIIRLFKDHTRQSSMDIRNENPFPVFFKICSSNRNVFVPHPTAGRISPYNKVTINIPFYTSATPVREHEEIIVLTSQRPFTKLQRTCHYCYGSHLSQPRKYLDRNEHKRCFKKHTNSKTTHKDKTIVEKLELVCKFCKAHIETRNMKLGSSSDLGYRKYSGILSDHKCAMEDNITNENMESYQHVPYRKTFYKSTSECKVTKNRILHSVDDERTETFPEHSTESRVSFPKHHNGKCCYYEAVANLNRLIKEHGRDQEIEPAQGTDCNKSYFEPKIRCCKELYVKPPVGDKADSSSEHASKRDALIREYNSKEETKIEYESLDKFSENSIERNACLQDPLCRGPKDSKYGMKHKPCKSHEKCMSNYRVKTPHICAKVLVTDFCYRDSDEESSHVRDHNRRNIVFISENDVSDYGKTWEEYSGSLPAERLIIAEDFKQDKSNKEIMKTVEKNYTKILRMKKSYLFLILLTLIVIFKIFIAVS